MQRYLTKLAKLFGPFLSGKDSRPFQAICDKGGRCSEAVMDSISASSPDDLVSRLEALSLSVLPRGEGRTKDQTEDWSRRTVLGALARTRHFSYPMTAISSDQPDLDLHFPLGTRGVEITEAVPRAYAAAVAFGNRSFPGAIIDRSLFGWTRPVPSKKELRQYFTTSASKLTGPGWDGDSVEREWAEGLFDTICKKTESINGPEYRAFPEYWLAVYDNLRGPALDLELAMEMLTAKRSSFPVLTRAFSLFLIEVGDQFVVMDQTGLVDILPLPGPERGRS